MFYIMFYLYFVSQSFGKVPAITIYFIMFYIISQGPNISNAAVIKMYKYKKKLCNQFSFLWTTHFLTWIFVSFQHQIVISQLDDFFFDFDSLTHEWHIFYICCVWFLLIVVQNVYLLLYYYIPKKYIFNYQMINKYWLQIPSNK